MKRIMAKPKGSLKETFYKLFYNYNDDPVNRMCNLTNLYSNCIDFFFGSCESFKIALLGYLHLNTVLLSNN